MKLRSYNTTIIRMWAVGHCHYIEFIFNHESIYSRHLTCVYASNEQEARRKWKKY